MRAPEIPEPAPAQELVQLRDELNQRQQQYRDMIENSVQGIGVNVFEKPLFVNRAYANMLGYDSPQEILDLGTVDKIIAPSSLRKVKAMREARMRGENVPIRYEYEALRKDGSLITVEAIHSMINWEGQRAIQHALFDISAMKHARANLQESEKRYRELIENSVQGILIRTKHRRIMVNAAYVRMFGYDSVEEILALPTQYSLLAPGDVERVRAYDTQRLQGEPAPISFEVQGVRKNGERIWLHEIDRLITWRGEPALQITFIDITEKKRAEEELRESEQRYRALVEGSAQGISIRNAERRLFVNSAFVRVFGFKSIEEALEEGSEDIMVAPEQREKKRDYYRRRLKGSRAPETHEERMVRRDGSAVWVLSVSQRVEWEGAPALHIAITDITRQKKSEEELRESESRYRDLIEGSAQGIVIRTKSRLVMVNETLARMFGYNSMEDVKRLARIKQLAAPHERERLAEYGRARFRGDPAPSHYEFEGQKADGSRIWVSAVTRLVQWNGQPAIQSALTDISESRRSQDEIVARKLESIGALAKGIAGEFNTIYSTTLSSISLAKMESYALGTDRISEILSEAEETSSKAKDLIQQLLVLSRGGSPAKERIRVEEIIKECLPFAGTGRVVPIKGENIKFQMVLSANLHPVAADRVQMKQVFRIIIANGVQSMPFGGTLAIAAENVVIKPGARGIHLEAGKYVKVAVKDQGQGIHQGSVDNLFDPYFSTDSKGGGLELSSAFSIVKAHGGTISVHSTLGRGTRLTIYLPAILQPDAKIK